MAVRIISTWLLRLFKRLALRHWVLCQGLAVSTGSNLTGKCVIIATVEGWGRQGKRKRGWRGEWRDRIRRGAGWMDAGFRDKRWNKWTDAAKEGRRGFTVDRLRQAELGKKSENVTNL